MSRPLTPHPFRWAQRLVERITAPHLREEILGDLDELFHQRLQRHGFRKAQVFYLLDILLLLHPRLWRRKAAPAPHRHFPNPTAYSSPSLLHPAMIRNYLKIAWRNLVKDRLYSFINLGGLAVGMAVTMLLALFVSHEYSYDRFHSHSEQIYKMVGEMKVGDQDLKMMFFDYDQTEAFRRQIPAVADVARHETYFGADMWVESDRQHRFKERAFLFADPGFFRVFSYPVRQGDPQRALLEPFKVFLTQRAARKYFGAQNPTGQTIRLMNKYTFEVVGLLDNPPSNSSISFDFVASFPSLDAIHRTENESFYKQFPSKSRFVAKFQTHLLIRNPDQLSSITQLLEKSFKTPELGSRNIRYRLVPLTSLHLSFEPKMERSARIFTLVAGLILLLALVNYVNLTTARATVRAKEVAIRKTTGAQRSSLILQFLLESVLMSTLAFGVGLILFWSFQPTFSRLLDLKADDHFLESPSFAGALLVIYLLSVLLSSLYPAVALSRFSPMQALRGRLNRAGSGTTLRRVLAVNQFVVTVGLIICSIVMYRQWNFMQRYSGNMKRERVVFVSLEQQARKKAAAFRQQISQLSGVEHVSGTEFNIVGGHMSFGVKHRRTAQEKNLFNLSVDREFFKTLNVTWEVEPDWDHIGNRAFVLNEAALKALNITTAQVGDSLQNNGENSFYLAGVVKDFPIGSLSKAIDPISIRIGTNPDDYSGLYIRLAPQATAPRVLQAIHGVYNRFKVEEPFTYQFLEDAYADLYKSERQLAQLFAAATVIAILIACLGIFGLAAFTAEQRTKEIGIRKVLGASVSSLVAMLSRDFLKLVLIALVIASPLAWYAMNQWLDNFAYKTAIDWWIFALAGSLAVGIALLTVSFQSIKAALVNPVKSLRSE
ncbi:ABC transporter permease [Larkinella insperata]|uniref:ABC transporter permease n=1 Tax=Larkinella insperata TaxID=332158 RepID=A0ABW3QJC8_9BACT|nr:ABC transporter permease [Larkinella insperata]